MKIHHFHAKDLTPDHWATWARLQESNPALDSPYFRPEFTQAVAAVRDDVEIGVLEEAGEAVGFFPFQRTWKNIAKPVGAPMNDFQGAIIRRGLHFEPKAVLRACGLVAWRFNHLVASQVPFHHYHCVTIPSPYLDVSKGYEEYYLHRRKTGGKRLKQMARRYRCLNREVGPVRFEPASSDRDVFETLLHWKDTQCKDTGVASAFSVEWIRALLTRIFEHRTQGFHGMLTTLHAGDELVAIDFGLRSHGVFHSWICAYNRKWSRYSPGNLLLIETAKHALELGIKRIDLGKGMLDYKSHFMSGTIPVAEGAVDVRPVGAMLWRGWCHTRDWLRDSRFRGPAHRVDRLISQVRNRFNQTATG